MKAICRDLREEYEALDKLVTRLSAEEWSQVTPFYNWTIHDEISHIAFFDGTALLATRSREEFTAHAASYGEAKKHNDSLPAIINGIKKKVPKSRELLSEWRQTRNQLLDRLEGMNPKDRLPWYGPDMSALSFATARLMETWAHGQDIYDTLRVRRKNGDRLKHIAHLGVSTFGWSYVNRKLPVPEIKLRVELESPSGEVWNWGPVDADHRLFGKAEDFCLVVTQRRHFNDTGLRHGGEETSKWLRIAQCFAGGPATGPKPAARAVVYAR